MPVREARAGVEMIARKPTEAIEMRRDMGNQFRRQMNVQQILQRLIRAIEVQPGRIGGDGIGAGCRLHGAHGVLTFC